jgi:hypothetical protein
MAQTLESTEDFDICGSLNSGTVRVSTANSEGKVISSGRAIFRPATAELRLNKWAANRAENTLARPKMAAM